MSHHISVVSVVHALGDNRHVFNVLDSFIISFFYITTFIQTLKKEEKNALSIDTATPTPTRLPCNDGNAVRDDV